MQEPALLRELDSVVGAAGRFGLRVDPAAIAVDVPPPVDSVDNARYDSDHGEFVPQQLLEVLGSLNAACQERFGGTRDLRVAARVSD